MSKLIIRKRRAGDNILILTLEGKLRLGEDNVEFHNTIRQLIEKGEKYILLNLGDVSYIDSTGLGELVSSYVAVTRVGGQIKLLNLTKRVHELMTVTKLATVFDIYENEADAVESFKIPVSTPEKQMTAERGLL
jgi:anti-sigma B factor antagonist